MGKTASEREEHYKQQVAAYLQAIQMLRGWSQSEIARQAGVRSTTINKALKLKHATQYPTLLALEDRSGIPIPDELKQAARGLNEPATVPAAEVQDFLNSSPEWQRMVELGRQLSEATNPKAKREIKRELDELLAKVA